MLSPLTSTTQTPPVAQPAALAHSSTPPKPEASGSGKTDAVQLSSAAQAILKEASETPAQTAKEASGGDMVAKRLLAKEQARQAAEK